MIVPVLGPRALPARPTAPCAASAPASPYTPDGLAPGQQARLSRLLAEYRARSARS